MNQYRKKKKKTRRWLRAQKIRQKKKIKHLSIACGIMLAAILIIVLILVISNKNSEKSEIVVDMNTEKEITSAADLIEPPYDVQLLTVNEYSRPGIARDRVNSIVIHYTANPGSTAQDNRDYFENLKNTGTTHASSHFIIGLEGELIQCIPTMEISYTSNNRNVDTVSIECCHPDESGVFTDATYQTLVQTSAWLCLKFGLTGTDLLRHYDITGKNCPKWFVEDPDAWNQFRIDVDARILSAQNYYNENYGTVPY